MKGGSLRMLALLLLVVLVGGNVSAEEPTTTFEAPVVQPQFLHPSMQPDPATLARWQKEYLEAPRAKINPQISRMLENKMQSGIQSSMDLLGHIDYVPTDRDQGNCGNCWVWAGTGVAEIAHDVEDGVFNRLSIQYLDSCLTTDWACCGGWLEDFADWYNGQGFMIPWDNTNASFADSGLNCGAGGSGVPCGSISTTPQYGLSTITAETIETHTGQANAIANIKNILNQNRGVWWGFYVPTDAAWHNFNMHWALDGETDVWNDVDNWCGDDYTSGHGHAVLIYGYNDDDLDPANHYWLVLNSWGTAGGGRPNGVYRIPMVMDYDCVYPDPPNNTSYYAFYFQTLDIEFSNTPPVADAGGPYVEECEGTTTTAALDGSGSTDLDNDALDFLWTTDCPGGSFDDATSATPVLTVDTLPGCTVECDVTLTVTDEHGASDGDTDSVTINDPSPPVLSVPADVAVECDASTDPADTGYATAIDGCDPAPIVIYTDVELEGACPQAKTITRTWTATDACGNTDSAVQLIHVGDTTPPVIACNAPPYVSPPQAPITFVATSTDNCDADPVEAITGYECYKFTKKGKKIDKSGSCIVEIAGDSITIHDVGGVGTFIAWDVVATDACGNAASQECQVEVIRHTPKGIP